MFNGIITHKITKNSVSKYIISNKLTNIVFDKSANLNMRKQQKNIDIVKYKLFLHVQK